LIFHGVTSLALWLLTTNLSLVVWELTNRQQTIVLPFTLRLDIRQRLPDHAGKGGIFNGEYQPLLERLLSPEIRFSDSSGRVTYYGGMGQIFVE